MRHPKRRLGYGLLEVAIAVALLAVALSATLIGVGRIADERKSLDRRQRANQEAMNALERFLLLPWSERTAEKAKGLTLDPDIAKLLSGASLKVVVSDAAGPPPARKVEVEVFWGASAGAGPSESPVRLVAWTYPESGGPR